MAIDHLVDGLMLVFAWAYTATIAACIIGAIYEAGVQAERRRWEQRQ